MTWIIDNTGTRWVEPTPPKRRKSPMPKRFASLKVGDQIMQATESKRTIRDPNCANDKYITVPYTKSLHYFIVTDMWFDPVRGQSDPVAGQMVGFAAINQRGEVSKRKSSMPIRGFASQRFEFADRDHIAWCKARLTEIENGKVVGIGHGRTIRKRPKIPGSRL